MGLVTGIVQRCGVAVAALALLGPTTTTAFSPAESPFVGGVACLSDEQRSELVRREMGEMLRTGIDLSEKRRLHDQALSAQAQAASALERCQRAPDPFPPGCDAERTRLASADAEVERTLARREKAKDDFPVLAAARVQAIRAEYPACDSR